MVYNLKFDPQKNGIRQILGELEADIMEIIWKLKEASGRQVYDELKQKRDIAYTTIMTVIGRLTKKGILKRTQINSVYLFKPVLSKNDFTSNSVKQIMKKLLNDFSIPAMNHFVDFLDDEDPDKIEELARIIEARRKQKK